MNRRQKPNTKRSRRPTSSAKQGKKQSNKQASNDEQSTQTQTPTQNKQVKRQWYRVDLHLHTPASNDYEEVGATYLDWMRKAVEQDLDVVAVTDHNTVAGVGAIRDEIEWLVRLEEQKRLTDEERQRLKEWRELSEKVLVLPGFEFTATFGFHILGIFAPETSVRQLEHVLLTLNVPSDKLDEGSTETGAGTDVLTAYRVIREAGGIAIAAHANSTHGVAMRDFPFGGQTKISYTQDANLDALEVTDLARRGRSTARFFRGNKTEYPRRMHCIQGSDAHRVTADPKNAKRLGIGDRATQMLLDAPTFDAIAELLRSENFDRTRAARPKDEPFDPVLVAREEGPTLTQSFHESASQRGGRLTAILSDVCAFANGLGGTIYLGATHRKSKPAGLPNPKEVQTEIQAALEERLTPPLDVQFDICQSQEAQILRMRIPKGKERPYCLDSYKFYIRDEVDTNLAVRDEIVALVQEVSKASRSRSNQNNDKRSSNRSKGGNQNRQNRNGKTGTAKNRSGAEQEQASEANGPFYLPQVGVEIVDTTVRNGNKLHSIRDMRNGNVIKNVTRKGARKLWNYAIQKHEDRPVDPEKIEWKENVGLIGVEKRAGKTRYDLALRENGNIRTFYGVTEDGMEGRWALFVQDDEEESVEA